MFQIRSGRYHSSSLTFEGDSTMELEPCEECHGAYVREDTPRVYHRQIQRGRAGGTTPPTAR